MNTLNSSSLKITKNLNQTLVEFNQENIQQILSFPIVFRLRGKIQYFTRRYTKSERVLSLSLFVNI